ncbi:unnamed protein product [Closterium sp. NIES-53]
MYLMTCTRRDLAYPLSILARYVAPGRHQPEHMAAAKRVLRYLCSTSGMGLVLGGRSPVILTGHADASWADDQATQRSCEAEIYAGAMAAQELRWLTYLLTDLGEPPRSPPVLYVDNKAMLALCREQRLEHRTKHIALCYFLAHELQQRGQLRLAYVASEANTADIFTKALAPCDHQRFCTELGLAPRPLILTAATATATTPAATAATAALACCTALSSLRILAFDHEGGPVQFHTWLDDLQMYLLSDIKDGVSLFDHVSGAATAPPTTADGATRSQWLSRDAAARLAIRNHLPLAECAHFEQHCTTLAVAVGAARGPPRPPFFEGCSPSPLAPSYASAAAADVSVAEDVGVASASAKHRSGKGKGGKGGGGGGGGGGGSSGSSGGGSSGGGGGGGTGGGSGGSGGGGGGNGGSGGGGGSGTNGGGTGARRVGSGGGQRQQQQRQSETQSPQQLRE